MVTCEVCGNDYDKTFGIRQGDKTYVFDCCARCASAVGIEGVADRV